MARAKRFLVSRVDAYGLHLVVLVVTRNGRLELYHNGVVMSRRPPSWEMKSV